MLTNCVRCHMRIGKIQCESCNFTSPNPNSTNNSTFVSNNDHIHLLLCGQCDEFIHSMNSKKHHNRKLVVNTEENNNENYVSTNNTNNNSDFTFNNQSNQQPNSNNTSIPNINSGHIIHRSTQNNNNNINNTNNNPRPQSQFEQYNHKLYNSNLVPNQSNPNPDKYKQTSSPYNNTSTIEDKYNTVKNPYNTSHINFNTTNNLNSNLNNNQYLHTQICSPDIKVYNGTQLEQKYSEQYVHELKDIYEKEQISLLEQNSYLKSTIDTLKSNLNNKIDSLLNELESVKQKSETEKNEMEENYHYTFENHRLEKESEVKFLYNKLDEMESKNVDMMNKLNTLVEQLSNLKIYCAEKERNYELVFAKQKQEASDLINMFENKIINMDNKHKEEQELCIKENNTNLNKLLEGYQVSKQKLNAIILAKEEDLRVLLEQENITQERFSNQVREVTEIHNKDKKQLITGKLFSNLLYFYYALNFNLYILVKTKLEEVLAENKYLNEELEITTKDKLQSNNDLAMHKQECDDLSNEKHSLNKKLNKMNRIAFGKFNKK